MTKKKFIAIVLIIGFIGFCILQNNLIVISNHDIESPKVSKPVRIVHLSDLHDKQFGKGNKFLIDKVMKQKPDIIVFTGDLINWKTKDFASSINTLGELNKSVQVFYIPGNHEYRSGRSELIFQMLKEVNIEVLNCKTKSIEVDEENIEIIGIDESVNSMKVINETLSDFEKSNNFKIVLSHFPEKFSSYYCNYNVDLVLSGHAHGGQFNIPFIGGVYAPGQGFFPKYYKGLHSKNDVNLAVSRGLGNSKIPLRLFNYPEIVVINLKPSK